MTGCGVHFNVHKSEKSPAEYLEKQELTADPVAYSADGNYTATVHYEKGGFEKMDLSMAYVAYHPSTVMEQVDQIVSADTEEVPPLPDDAQQAVDEVTGAEALEKVAVVTVETKDDNTVKVSFHAPDDPVGISEYYFIIPNEELAGTITVEDQM